MKRNDPHLKSFAKYPLITYDIRVSEYEKKEKSTLRVNKKKNYIRNSKEPQLRELVV